jgi:citrate lyase subunit beta/citryl-CoA lyase
MKNRTTSGNCGEDVRSDCFVELVTRRSGGIDLRLESRVERIYGQQIRVQVNEVLAALGVQHAAVRMEDSGALPFVIAARLEAAVRQLTKEGRSCLPGLIGRNRYETGRLRPRFSRLYLPGNTPSLMLNAGIHKPDGIILDLEDSVAPQKKPEARVLVRNALLQVDFYGAERMVRINQLPAGLEDLDWVVPHHLHMVLIPKCERGAQVKEVDDRISRILKVHGQEREVFLMPIIESCLGIENAFEIATSCDSVAAMAIGLEDFTADLGVPRTSGGEESLYARTRLVNACKAAGIQPIDSVYSDVADLEGLKEHAVRSRSLGFEGMGCIHPRQIPVIHEGFSPTLEEIERAEKIIEAYEEARSKGLGVISIGTKMIDPPVVRRAERTMELAFRFGLREAPDDR